MLAATWPAERRVLVVEADPAGGTLAAASGWPPEPSLVSLAAAARRSNDPEAVWGHCHRLPGGTAVLAAPAGADQARSAARMLAGLFDRFGELDADVLVDTGRLDPAAPMPGVAIGADRVVLVARPKLADLHAVAGFLGADPGARLLEAGRSGLVLVGDGPYPDGEITEALGVGVLGRLPWDPEAAELLAVLAASDRRLRLSPLVRAARSLADALAADAALAADVAAEPAPRADPVLPPAEKVRAGRLLRDRLLRPFRTGQLAETTTGSPDVGITGLGIPGTGAVGDGAACHGALSSKGAGSNGVVGNGAAPGGEAGR
ncbi:MAG: MinD/ParA family ATP-binding protein [Acidimicrobiales bacterium]